jgi:hypothetical protein
LIKLDLSVRTMSAGTGIPPTSVFRAVRAIVRAEAKKQVAIAKIRVNYILKVWSVDLVRSLVVIGEDVQIVDRQNVWGGRVGRLRRREFRSLSSPAPAPLNRRDDLKSYARKFVTAWRGKAAYRGGCSKPPLLH